ncbi:MAG: hypothetical protein PHX52_00550 [Candidatus Pacebacteria bacterium]|nr:hypothetical protein [Candidatus Paceibacterota bacterium]MDD3919055.1 hypothetical protein [Candidatus Paceibacterota bacterium]
MSLFFIENKKEHKKWILISTQRDYLSFAMASIFAEGGIFTLVEVVNFPETIQEAELIKRNNYWGDYPKVSVSRLQKCYEVFDEGKHLLFSFSDEDIISLELA